MVVVLAMIEVKEGFFDEYLAAFHKLMPLVHEEDGCIEYAPTVDCPSGIGAQSPTGPTTITVVEKWESVEALQNHIAAPHMNAFRESNGQMVVDMVLYVLEPA